MNFETIEYAIDKGIGQITMNRPKALNALNRQVLEELNVCLNQIEEDKSLRCLIVTGSGDKAFVAGADIKEMENLDSQAAKDFGALGQKVFRRLEVLKVPVIASVNGFALGGGLELAMACDFIVASSSAKFGLPEVSLGLIPGFGGTVRLPRIVGRNQAREMIFTGLHYDAETAKSFGLVNQVVEPENLKETTLKLAKKISKQGPVAIAMAKEAMNVGGDLGIDEALNVERRGFGDLFKSKDKDIGIQAFINKERPEFIGE
ncbi:MAG: enoyl-CoA hydratase/isomerase family protein [Bdellovibrionales bacterium]